MTLTPPGRRAFWRVGYHADPIGFPPWEIYEFSRRFDDPAGRFRTLYCAEMPETCLREVLADFRPNLAAMARHLERYGAAAADDFVPTPVTAQWRSQHVLAPVEVALDGPLVDLTDPLVRHEVEDRHRALLVANDLPHLDLHEITTSRRAITQEIAADLYDGGAAAVRFPSRLDGLPCIALFEDRGTVALSGATVPLTDPPPAGLAAVATEWGLELEAVT